MSYPITRLRRTRSTPQLRKILQSVHLNAADLIMPMFVHAGIQKPQAIPSMQGQFQHPISTVAEVASTWSKLGIQSIILFGIPAYKDAVGSAACKADGVIQQAIQKIKSVVPNMLIIADLCFCEYTDHGHCGALSRNNPEMVDNDLTLELLATQALSLAKAGVDIIAPSGMMDGVVGHLRKALDQENYQNLPILSYAVKYASHFYEPFRDAAQGAAKKGDRKHYQMDYRRTDHDLTEAGLDIQEGADFIIIKPAHSYLDILYRCAQQFPNTPRVAFHVSGEYAMLKSAISQGLLPEKEACLEVLFAMKRAGADLIISYLAVESLQKGWIQA